MSLKTPSEIIQSWGTPNIDISEPEDRIDSAILDYEGKLRVILTNNLWRSWAFFMESMDGKMEKGLVQYFNKRFLAMLNTVIRDSWIQDFSIASKGNGIFVQINWQD